LSEQDSNHSNQQVVVNRSPEIKKREIIDLYDLAISNYPKDMEIFMVLSEEFLFRYSSKEFLPIL